MDEILIEYFKPVIDKIAYSNEVNAYILNLLIKINKSQNFSKESLTLKYIEAKENYNFSSYQSLGDWIMFCQIYFPKHLNNAEEKYYNAIAQTSYYNCYIMLKRQWKLFEELADLYPDIVKDLRNSSKNISLNDSFSSRKLY